MDVKNEDEIIRRDLRLSYHCSVFGSFESIENWSVPYFADTPLGMEALFLQVLILLAEDNPLSKLLSFKDCLISESYFTQSHPISSD